jgi:uncharacterized membrane protein
MFHLVRQVSAGILWANLALLFCLSLFPLTTAWMDDSQFAWTPVAVYGVNLLAAAIAYFVLQTVIIRQQGADSPLRRAVGRDFKGRASPIFYIVGILSATLIDRDGRVGVWIALACFVAVAIIWVVPDRRIVRALREHASSQ